MYTITLDLNIPADFNVDLDALKSAATDYMQRYIYMLQTAKKAKTRNKESSAIRELRGCISSDYKENHLDSAIKATKQEKLFETSNIDKLMDSLMK